MFNNRDDKATKKNLKVSKLLYSSKKSIFALNTNMLYNYEQE